MLAGYFWRRLRPGGIDQLELRRVINALALYIFYPALIIVGVNQASLDPAALLPPLISFAVIGVGLFLAWLAFSWNPWLRHLPGPTRGALILAATFGNVLSVGTPVLKYLYSEIGIVYAFSTDLIAVTPLLWIAGPIIGLYYGTTTEKRLSAWLIARNFLTLPPLLAFFAALVLRAIDVSLPSAVLGGMSLAGQALIPCLLLTVGLAFTTTTLALWWPAVGLALAIRLILAPALVWGALLLLALEPSSGLRAGLLEAAMPTMMSTLVISERYGCDTATLSAAIGLSSVAFLLTVTVWLGLSAGLG